MKTKPIWTESKARLTPIRSNDEKNYNWLFLPGGPGLGSESLHNLTDILHLPGTLWHVDLPGDGSNISENNKSDFSNWQTALIEVTQKFDNTILVAHSSGGMFALATPEIEKNLTGLVLMDSAPNTDWQTFFSDYVSKHPIAEAEKLQNNYQENPSNDILKKLTLACAPYFSICENLEKITTLIRSLPFNYESHLWSEKNFDSSYQAQWVPHTIPTLIFSGDQDHITPLKLFTEASHFQRDNIVITEIKNAAHFPWIDNPEQIKQVFADYCDLIIASKGKK